MAWPPQLGELLPRADKAWCVCSKLTGWVLAEQGHGREWSRVFHVGDEEADLIWRLISKAVLTSPVIAMREGRHGIGCGVLFELTIGARVAPVLSGWHYAHEDDSPRLVTAYPKPYNRGYGIRS